MFFILTIDITFNFFCFFTGGYPSEFLDDSNKASFWANKSSEFDSSLLSYVNIDLDEIDMTMSIASNTDASMKSSESFEMITDRKSICELRIFNVNTELFKSRLSNQCIKLKIFGLLLIDARQIYGTDYQLLAASHSQIELDSKTGRIKERMFNGLERKKSDSEAMKFKPLISIDLMVISDHDSNNKEYILKSSFSVLDIVLNPETISELIMLFYSTYLNITSVTNKGKNFLKIILATVVELQRKLGKFA